MAALHLSTDPTGKPSPLQLPHPPPLLHTRASNENYERPTTPTQQGSHGFTSPVQTPTGSPSKNKLPPGALNLPGVFEKAMKLTPSSPTKFAFGTPTSPGKGGLSVLEDYNESVIHKDVYQTPGSPIRRSNKENTPPSVPRLGKDLGLHANSAAVSRFEQYQQRDTDSARRTQTQTQRGLTAEELDKLQLPKVKRLANVTQLCKFARSAVGFDFLTVSQISWITTLISSATSTIARLVTISSKPLILLLPTLRLKNMNRCCRSIWAESEPIFGGDEPDSVRMTSRS